MTILTHATDIELAPAVQANLFALFRAMTVLPGGELLETPELCRHFAPATNPMFQGVWRTRLSPARAEAGIAETLDWFRSRGAAFVFWWTGTNSEPPDLADRLQAHGFAVQIAGDAGMAADIQDLSLSATPPDLSVVRVTTRRALEDWRDVFCTGFDAPLWAGQAWVDTTMAAGGAGAPWHMYVGYRGQTPVATSILFLGAGVAGLYGVATVPEARGQGIGAAVTLAPLADARRQGYRYSVLFSSEMGYPLYRRLGFRELGCRVGRYLWMNDKVEL